MTRPTAICTRLLAAVALLICAPLICAQDEPKKPTRSAEPVVEVKLIDDSVLELTLLDHQVEFLTQYGKLSIPVSEIRRVDLGLRIPDEVAAIIQAAVADLGSSQFRKRE